MRELAAELVLDAKAQVGESARWDSRSSRLVWVDIHGAAVHRYDPATGSDDAESLGAPVGAVALRRSGDYVVLVPGALMAWEPGAGTSPLVVVPEPAHRRFNDGACDAAGRMVAATIDTSQGAEGRGILYSITDRAVVRKQGIGLPNGIDWSLDGCTLYFTDSLRREIGCFEYDLDTGDVGEQTGAVAVPEGLPDGHTVDAEGNIWVAQWSAGSAVCLTPAGEVLARVRVPVAAVTSCAFGGADLSQLFITTMQQPDANGRLEPLAGALFGCDVGATGREPNQYAG